MTAIIVATLVAVLLLGLAGIYRFCRDQVWRAFRGIG